VAITIDPALTPKMLSNDTGPNSISASMTPAEKAQRKLPPSRMRVSKVKDELDEATT